MAWLATISSPSTSSRQMAPHIGPVPTRTPNCSGVCAAAAAISAWRPPSTIVCIRSPPSMAAWERMIDEPFGPGQRNYWKSNFLRGLDDALFEAMIEAYARVPSPRSALLIEQGGGAVARIDPDATAVHFRHAAFNLLILSMW